LFYNQTFIQFEAVEGSASPEWGSACCGMGGQLGAEFANMSDSEIQRADNTFYVFNESLQTACELGIIGIFLTGNIFRKIIINKNNEKKSVRFAMISILFASMFYFVFHSTLISLVTLLCLSFLFSDGKVFFCLSPPVSRIFFSLLLVGSLSVSFFNLSKYSAIKTLNILLTLDNNDLNLYKDLENKLNDNCYFLYNYAFRLFKSGLPTESLKTLSLLDRYAIRYETEILKGDAYEGDTEMAEKFYTNALNICPGKFSARHKLLNLYKSRNEKEKALNVAFGIIKLPEKIPSAITLAIKMDAEAYIHENKNQVKWEK
jgi:hypothetical protein